MIRLTYKCLDLRLTEQEYSVLYDNPTCNKSVVFIRCTPYSRCPVLLIEPLGTSALDFFSCGLLHLRIMRLSDICDPHRIVFLLVRVTNLALVFFLLMDMLVVEL